MCFDGGLETKASKSNLRSECIKCHYNFDHHEPYGQEGLVSVETLPFRVTGIATGGTTFAGGSRGSGVRANALAAHTAPSPAAERPVFGDAGLRAGGQSRSF